VMLFVGATLRHFRGNKVSQGRWPIAYAIGILAMYWTMERIDALII